MQEQNIWSRVEDAAVLNYLLENGTIKYNATVIQSHMYDLLNSHNVELVAALFKLLRDDIEHPAMLVYLHRSIDYLPMFKLFYEADKYSPNDHLTTLIRAIRSREAAEVVEFILTVYQPDDHVRDSLIVRAAIIGNVEAVKLLMSAAPDGGVSSVNIMYEFIDDYRAKILNDSSDRESGRIAVALYLLPQVDLARFGRLYNTTPLLYSLGKNRQELFKLLLTDPRVDPVAMLPRILASMNKHTTDAMIKILVSSPRFAIQQRTKKEVDMLLDAISVYSKQNTLEGYRIGVFRAGESNLDPKIASGKTLHSQIVRYIVLAQPTAAELLDWLIGLHDRTVATAASLVLDRDEKLGLGADSAIMQPIRALLLALLYPTVTLQEHIALLQADGYTKTAIVQSAALIGAFMGKERLQRE
ncbi:Hypothetical protein POVR2_LOCUS13 [uncultured virus]|nr:Hypothetical protein POVR2_LOCUS13 [uncultured virus]